MFTTGQQLAGRFALLRPLSSSASPVWLATETSSGLLVALKLSVDAQDAAEAEFAQQAALAHPHILVPRELVHANGVSMLVMRAGTGGTLANLRGQHFTRFLSPTLQAARAVSWLHEQSLVHGDLKADNVLVDAAGDAQLIDFGNCVTAGASRAAGAPFSPFTASPQQRAGEPARTADDVYSFGAMLFELLSGAPPGYTAGAHELRPLHPANAALLALVGPCLASNAADRPTMRHIVEVLEGVPADRLPAAAAPPILTPPQLPVDALRPNWQRPVQQAATADRGLHRQGFRQGALIAATVLLALLAIALFALPERLPLVQRAASPASPAPAAAAAPARATALDADQDLRETALVKSDAEALATDLAARLTGLNDAAVSQWAASEGAAANGELQAARALLDRREYAAARTALQALAGRVTGLEQQRATVLKRALDDGEAALAAHDSAAAAAAFALAQRIDARNAAAIRGAKRATVLDDAWAAQSRGATLEQQGNIGAAAGAYREALRLDPESREAQAALGRVNARLANDTFGRALAEVFAAIDARQPERARAALARAQGLRPADPALKDATTQLSALDAADQLSTALQAARDAESSERWAAAVEQYRAALAIDGTLLAAREGFERATARAALDAELAMLVAQPERVFSRNVFAAAGVTLQRAQAIPSAGPRLLSQRERVAELLRQAQIPVQVPLLSDNLTAVTIHRVGELGTFAEKRIELKPGRYTVVGSRAGFRDVRRELLVLPQAAATPLRVACEEPI